MTEKMGTESSGQSSESADGHDSVIRNPTAKQWGELVGETMQTATVTAAALGRTNQEIRALLDRGVVKDLNARKAMEHAMVQNQATGATLALLHGMAAMLLQTRRDLEALTALHGVGAE